jgi:hypothetical protein
MLAAHVGGTMKVFPAQDEEDTSQKYVAWAEGGFHAAVL